MAHRGILPLAVLALLAAGPALAQAPEANPRLPQQVYDATGGLPCTAALPIDRAVQCPFGVIRGEGGAGQIVIISPAGTVRTIIVAADGTATTPDGGDVVITATAEIDERQVAIGGAEFYLLPDIVLLGD